MREWLLRLPYDTFYKNIKYRIISASCDLTSFGVVK